MSGYLVGEGIQPEGRFSSVTENFIIAYIVGDYWCPRPDIHAFNIHHKTADIKPKNPMERNKIRTKIFGRRIDDNVRLSTHEWQVSRRRSGLISRVEAIGLNSGSLESRASSTPQLASLSYLHSASVALPITLHLVCLQFRWCTLIILSALIGLNNIIKNLVSLFSSTLRFKIQNSFLPFSRSIQKTYIHFVDFLFFQIRSCIWNLKLLASNIIRFVPRQLFINDYNEPKQRSNISSASTRTSVLPFQTKHHSRRWIKRNCGSDETTTIARTKSFIPKFRFAYKILSRTFFHRHKN